MTEDELLLGSFRNVPESAADAVKRSGEKAPEYSGIFRYFHENGLVPYALQSQTDVRGTLETLAKNPSGCPKLFGLLGDIMQRDDFPDPRGRVLLRNPGFRAALSEYLQAEFYTELCLSRCRVAHLKPGGRIAIITFHSLEDRIAKHVLKEMSRGCICPPELPVCVCHHQPEIRILGKPITAAAEELERNPRSKSAKLRIAEKLRGNMGGNQDACKTLGR